MSVGVAATMRVFGAAGRTTVRAQQQQVAVQQAQAEVDRLAALPYGELALTSAPPSSSDPQDPGYKVSGSNFAVRSDLTEALVLAPGAGRDRQGGAGAGGLSRSAPAGRRPSARSTATSPGATRTARCSLCEGAAEHQARDRRGDARSRCPAAAAAAARLGLDHRGGPRHRAARVPGAARWRPRTAATRSPPTRSTSTTLPAGRARGSPERRPLHPRHGLDGADRGGQLHLRAPGAPTTSRT